MGSDLSAAQSKAQYNENVINILERNYKQEVDALQRERDMLQRRAATTAEQARDNAVQLESLKIETLRQSNEIKFLRKEREEAFKRAQQSIGQRAKEQLEIQVKQAKEEGKEKVKIGVGLRTGRREGQQSRDVEVTKLKEVLAQYQQDVEKQSKVISNLNGEVEEMGVEKR